MNAVTKSPAASLPLRQVQDVKTLLMNDQARQQLAAVAAKHMNPERMMRVVANAIRTTPQLQQAEPLSMLGALMTCASLGLEPNTPLGHAYLVPFKNNRKGVTEVQLIIGYKGFADLARRSGQVVSIHADVVFSDDVAFSHEYGSNQHLRHVPGPRQGKMLGAYCHIRLKDGEGHVYMTGEEILAIRNASQGWRSAVKFGKTKESPWTTHEPRMWAKTALRRLANSGEMPLSIEFLNALDVDDAPADYRAFAMDPTGGIDALNIVEGEAAAEDGETVDEATGEVTEAEPAEEKKPAAKAAPRRHTEANTRVVPAEKKAEAAQDEPEQKGLDLETKDRKAAAAEIEKWANGVYARVIGDLMDDAPFDATMEHHAADLNALERDAPQAYARLMEEVEQFRPGADGDE